MSRYYTPFQTALDSNGDPISGAKLYFYETGTTTSLTTYSDSTHATANSNPVVADASGRFGDIFIQSMAQAKAVLKDASDVTIKTTDPIASGDSGAVSAKDYGVTMDGYTDDYAAAQAAIDANPGGIIDFGVGILKITATLIVTDGSTVLRGASSSVTKIHCTGANTDAVHFKSSTTAQWAYLVSCQIHGFQIYRNTDATSGAGLRLTQCSNFQFTDINILSFPEGIVIEGGKTIYGNRFISQVSTALTGLPIANTSCMRITTAATDGATYQPCWTSSFDNFKLAGGSSVTQKAIQDVLLIENGDGVFFSNGYLALSDEALVKFKPNVSGQSIAGFSFSSVYCDAVNQTTGTANCVVFEDDGFAGASTIAVVSFDSGCIIGNTPGIGLLSDHPAISNLNIDQYSIINCAGDEIDVESGSTTNFVGIPVNWTPVIRFTTIGDLSVGYAVQVGQITRTKDGLAHASFHIQTSSFTHTTASGNFAIDGIPFSAKTLANSVNTGDLYFQGITKANYTQFVTTIGSGGTSLTVNASAQGQTASVVDEGDVPTGGTLILRGNMTYNVGEIT